MSPSPKEQAQTEQFAAIYRRNQLPVMRSVERQVCGCDYGGTSWTTRKEADEIAGLLGLREGVHLLDLGSGSGWPALYWAETTGCNTVLTDLPFDSLRLAARRVIDDGLGTSCCFALASGIELPFSDGAFDAISHSDVLCCLPDKFAVLRSCHQALRRDGRMVFPVISIAQCPAMARHLQSSSIPVFHPRLTLKISRHSRPSSIARSFSRCPA